MLYRDDEHFVFDAPMREGRLTGVANCARRWQYWGDKGAIESICVRTRVDSPFVRRIQEPSYKIRLFSLTDAHCTDKVDVSKLSLRLIYSDRPFRTSFSISNLEFRSKELEFEVRMRTSQRLPVFTSWQNVEVYAFTSRRVSNIVLTFPSIRGGSIGRPIAFCESRLRLFSPSIPIRSFSAAVIMTCYGLH